MTTISWIIEQMFVRKVEGPYTDVVVTANWRCNGVETIGTGDDAKTYAGTAYGSSTFTAPSGAFTPYPDLQQEQVLDWVWAGGVDKTAIEANVAAQIENQINPPIACLPNPWLPPADNTPSAPKPLRDEQIVDPFKLPTSDVPPSVDGMSTNILG
jgi:hypothetical protein